jgi:hypothetical protein
MLKKAASLELSLEKVEGHADLLGTWMGLYQNLVMRTHIVGIRGFSRESFRQQLGMKGSVLFLARYRGQVVGADWDLQSNDKVYTQSSAYSERGYELSVSYPLMQAALEHLSCTAGVMDLGGAPHFRMGGSDGQEYFSRAGPRIPPWHSRAERSLTENSFSCLTAAVNAG